MIKILGKGTSLKKKTIPLAFDMIITQDPLCSGDIKRQEQNLNAKYML